MKVQRVGRVGRLAPGRLLTSFRVSTDHTIIDAGSMAEALSIESSSRSATSSSPTPPRHSGTLPFFVDNIFGMREDPFVVHSIPEAIKSVREHLFNNDIWPDFSMIPDLSASMRFSDLDERGAGCTSATSRSRDPGQPHRAGGRLHRRAG